MNLLTTVLWQAHSILAQSALPSGQDDKNEGWGGLIGIGVIILAVWVTMLLVRGLTREARERDEAEMGKEESNAEGRRSNAGREPRDEPTGERRHSTASR